MKKVNGKEVIDVTKFYDFVMKGIRESPRDVMDEVLDLYRECKCYEPDEFVLVRTEVDAENPKRLTEKYFSITETSPEFKAFAEVIVRYYLGRHDFDKERLARYFGSEEPGTAYLVNRGLIPEFNRDSKEIVKLGTLMSHYCDQIERQGRLTKI